MRLSNRKGPFFRVDKLHYDEIDDLARCIAELSAVDLLYSVLPHPLDAADMCTKDELISLPEFADFPRQTKKSELVARMPDGLNPLEALDIDVVELGGLEHLVVFRLLFFGNFHQDMTEFVMHELVSPFEQYDLSNDACFFQTRATVDSMIELKLLSELSHEILESDEEGNELIKLIQQLPERADDPVLARRYDKIVNRVARQLERLERIEAAYEVYELSTAAPSRERRARLLEKMSQPEAAMLMCDSILEDPENEEEREFAISFARRVAKKHGLDTRSNLGDPDPKIDQACIEVHRSSDNVELCAAAYYESIGFDAHYVENTLLRGLFGLAFWEIIFQPVPGAFFHPFQRGPADLYTADFVRSRRAQIEDRLQHTNQMIETIRTHFSEKQGLANQFVNWTWLDETLLEKSLCQIPVVHLQLIFGRMLLDLKNNTSGLPDLILFDETNYRLVEIKGPGDKLQKNQARWFRFFRAQQIPAEVVDVTYL